jgi:polyhydroxybutyrate depolymerase
MILKSLFTLIISFTPLLYAGNMSVQSWNIDGEVRTAHVYTPELNQPNGLPLVFVWHGHGRTASRFLDRFPLHKVWPEAIVVYPQGLKSKAPYDVNGDRTGWQYNIGDHNDRDLKFFDIMHKGFKKSNNINANQIHCTGSSNGGSFTYLLMQARPNIFASVTPAISQHIGREQIDKLNLPEIPIFHITGEKESSYIKQRNLVMKILTERASNRPKPWNNIDGANLYESKKGDVVWYLHADGHRWRTKDTQLVADFFKAYPKQNN